MSCCDSLRFTKMINILEWHQNNHRIYFGAVYLIVHLLCMNKGGVYFLDIIYLFLERGREGGREGEKHQCVVFHTHPTGDLDLQPRHVPWLRIEPATLWFTGQCSIHWATPSRAIYFIAEQRIERKINIIKCKKGQWNYRMSELKRTFNIK